MTKKQKPKKKINRRAREEFPALKPEFNLKTRKDLIDYDYINKLTDKEKTWLNKFSEEYVGASFGKKPLHRTKAMRKTCYDANNARNRCILTKSKAAGKSLYLDEIVEEELEDATQQEDLLINELDKKLKD